MIFPSDLYGISISPLTNISCYVELLKFTYNDKIY